MGAQTNTRTHTPSSNRLDSLATIAVVAAWLRDFPSSFLPPGTPTRRTRGTIAVLPPPPSPEAGYGTEAHTYTHTQTVMKRQQTQIL